MTSRSSLVLMAIVVLTFLAITAHAKRRKQCISLVEILNDNDKMMKFGLEKSGVRKGSAAAKWQKQLGDNIEYGSLFSNLQRAAAKGLDLRDGITDSVCYQVLGDHYDGPDEDEELLNTIKREL